MGACLYDVPDEARAFLHSPGWRGAFPRTGARFLSAAVCGKKAAAHKPPGGGAEGVATPQKAEDEKAPMAGRAADMGACLYDVPDEARAFLHSPGWRGAFPRTGARFLSAAVCGKKAAAHKPPGGGAEGVATPQKAEDEKAPIAGRAADMGAYL